MASKRPAGIETDLRELLAREVGSVPGRPDAPIRVALAFPNTYFVGMSNLGFQTVYRLFNAQDDVSCERVFLPPKQQLDALRTAGAPLLSLETRSRVADFDVIAFSVSFEWDYPNVVTMLRLAGVPVRAETRRRGDPLVVIGGAITFLNPEPLAPFADVVAAGEGEVLVPDLIRELRATRDRRERVGALAERRGFYVPSLYTVRYGADGQLTAFEPQPGTGAPAVVQKAAVPAHAAIDPPHTSIFTPDTEFGSRFLVEVVRGCANLCRFCWAGYNYLPVRPFSADRILELARAARVHAKRAGLVSIALCDHPEIDRILRTLLELGYSISPASLRLDDLTPEIVGLLRESGERGLTIAPETGSDRLRRVINKTITNDQILERAELIFASGFENLKLYFMIGLPTETEEDVVAIRDLTAQLREIMVSHARRRGRIGRLVASVNPMIPKPGTTFQWLPLENPAVIDRRARQLRRLVAGLGNVYFNIKSERHSFYQGLLSLGDRRVADVIECVERNRGDWPAAAAEAGVDPHHYLFRDRSGDGMLPWAIIDGGLRESFFRDEMAKAMQAEWTLPPKRRPGQAPFVPVS